MKNKKVMIAIGAIAAVALAYFGYKWYQKNKKDNYVAPKPTGQPIHAIDILNQNATMGNVNESTGAASAR